MQRSDLICIHKMRNEVKNCKRLLVQITRASFANVEDQAAFGNNYKEQLLEHAICADCAGI